MALPQNVMIPLKTVAEIVDCLHRHPEDAEAVRLKAELLRKLQSLVDREEYRKQKGYR